jgi:hypothetical protein
MNIDHITTAVELQFHPHLSFQFEIGWIFILNLSLNFLNFVIIQSAVYRFPKFGVTHVGSYILFLGIFILYKIDSTMSCSIRYSFRILPY